MYTEVRKASPVFNHIVKATLGKFLLKKYQVNCEINITKELKPPYFILANHVNNLDPFFFSLFVDHPVHFVVSDEQYRSPIKRFFFNYLLGTIPKTKFVSDIGTVKHIIKLVRQDAVIGIFPEGRRNWDGKTGEILPSTSKLIKTLKIPVVICILEGAYLSHPRWALKDRFGKITVSFKTVLTEKTIHSMNLEQIHQYLSNLLAHDEYQIQEKKMLPYHGPKLAEKLERFLFICPKCHAIATLYSNNNIFSCKKCNYNVTYLETGYFKPADGEPLSFENPCIWNMWQLQYLDTYLNEIYGKKEEALVYQDKNVKLYSADRFDPLKEIAAGQLVLSNRGFYFLDDNKECMYFDLQTINGLNIQYSNELEFYYQDRLYRFKFADIAASAYKWTTALQYCRKIKMQDSLINQVNNLI